MSRFLAPVSCLLLLAGSLPAQPQKRPAPIPLVLTPAGLPVPALRFRLLPELRDQTPGNGAVHYRKAGELIEKIPPVQGQRAALSLQMYEWEKLPPSELPRDEARKALALYKEPFELLARGARSEYCDFEIAQRIREKGIGALLPECQQMRNASMLLGVQLRLELADGRPDLALRTLQTAYAIGRHVADEPTLVNGLVGIAITVRANDALQLVLSQPKTPNLSWSLITLPQPFIDLRRPFQGERLMYYSVFPGLQEVASNLDAGPMPAEQLQKLGKVLVGLLAEDRIQASIFDNLPLPVQQMANRVTLGSSIRARHVIAKKALIAVGRPADQIEKWPHLQVALLHALLELDQLSDEMLKWQALPHWQNAAPLEALQKKIRRPVIRGPDAPAIPLAPLLLPPVQKILLNREKLERQFAALRLIEAIRLYAANHEGKLPPSLAAIKEVPLPVCPLTGKSFEYRLEGERAILSAPPAPPSAPTVQPLRYGITLRRPEERNQVQP